MMIKLNAGCPISLKDAICLSLDTLNASVKEYPWFLAHKFGEEVLLSELVLTEQNSSLSKEQKQRLETLEYWTGQYSPERYRELKRTWGDRIKG